MNYKEELYQMIKDKVINHVYVNTHRTKDPEQVYHNIYFTSDIHEPGKSSFDTKVRIKKGQEGFEPLLDMYNKCVQQRDIGHNGTTMVYELPIDWNHSFYEDDPFVIEDFNVTLDERHYAVVDNFIAQKEKEKLTEILSQDVIEKITVQRI